MRPSRPLWASIILLALSMTCVPNAVLGGATGTSIDIRQCSNSSQSKDHAPTAASDTAAASLQQGDGYLLAREYDKAISAYRSALQQQPRWTTALQKLGDALLATGKDEEATGVFQLLTQIDATRSDYRYTLGLLYERQGLLSKAEQAYRSALEFDPRLGDARRHLADIYTLQGKLSYAIHEYETLTAAHQENPLLHFKLARIHDRVRHYRQAITEYETTICLAPDNPEARRELAELYRKRGMTAKAVEQYQALLASERTDRKTRSKLTALYVYQKSYIELLQLLEEDTQLFPDDPDSHYRLGLFYVFKRQYDQAKTAYQKALTLKKDHARALKGMGELYLKSGDLKKARGYLEAAKRADPQLRHAKELLNNLTLEERVVKYKQQKIKKHRKKKTTSSKNRKKRSTKKARKRSHGKKKK